MRMKLSALTLCVVFIVAVMASVEFEMNPNIDLSCSCSCHPVQNQPEQIKPEESTPVQNQPTDCVDAQRSNKRSGVVTIYAEEGSSPLQVYCDQDTDGGGWLVFQRRQDGSVNFYRNLVNYQEGFGDVKGEFWLGLDALHLLTSIQRYELRVDVMVFNGTKGYATYNNFTVSDSSDNYRISTGNYTGEKAGDSLTMHSGMQFTTRDADHDTLSSGNCAQERHGAWWYTGCTHSNLNGRYKDSRQWGYDGMFWHTLDGYYSLKFAEMKMRPL